MVLKMFFKVVGYRKRDHNNSLLSEWAGKLNVSSNVFYKIFTPWLSYKSRRKSLEKPFKQQELYINDKIKKNKHHAAINDHILTL